MLLLEFPHTQSKTSPTFRTLSSHRNIIQSSQDLIGIGSHCIACLSCRADWAYVCELASAFRMQLGNSSTFFPISVDFSNKSDRLGKLSCMSSPFMNVGKVPLFGWLMRHCGHTRFSWYNALCIAVDHLHVLGKHAALLDCYCQNIMSSTCYIKPRWSCFHVRVNRNRTCGKLMFVCLFCVFVWYEPLFTLVWWQGS